LPAIALAAAGGIAFSRTSKRPDSVYTHWWFNINEYASFLAGFPLLLRLL